MLQTLQTIGVVLAAPTMAQMGDHPSREQGLGEGKPGGALFAAGSMIATGDWTELRDRWEWSHVARAALTVASLVALVVAMAIRPA